jgi:hypothetical protein
LYKATFVFLVLGILAGDALDAVAQRATSVRLPAEVPLSDIEMTLELQAGGGGCLGRCMAYRVVIHGTGLVDFDDLGGEPRTPHQQRTLAPDETLSLLNDFLSARFFDRPSSDSGRQMAQRNGDSVQILQRGSIDGAFWILSLQLGQQRKAVRLVLDEPDELKRLRERMIAIGGPDAWKPLSLKP